MQNYNCYEFHIWRGKVTKVEYHCEMGHPGLIISDGREHWGCGRDELEAYVLAEQWIKAGKPLKDNQWVKP